MQAQTSPNAPSSARRKLRLTVGDLFKLMFAASAGLAAAAHSMRTDSSGGFLLLLVLEVIVAVGLLSQAWDLAIAYRTWLGLGADEVFSWLFAIIWRIAIGLLMLAACVVAVDRTGWMLSFAVREEADRWTIIYIFESIERLALFIAISASVPVVVSLREHTNVGRLRGIIVWIAAIAVCLIYLRGQTSILNLVFVAITGIERSGPAVQYTYGAYEGINPDIDARSLRFALTAFLPAACVLLTLGLIARFMSRWKRTGRASGWLLLGIVIAWLPTVVYPLWIRRTGLNRLSPPLAESQLAFPRSTWALALLLGGALILAGAYRLAAEPSSAGGHWRRRTWRYFHERRTVLLLLFFALVVITLEVLANVGTPVYAGQFYPHWMLNPLMESLTLPLICITMVALYRRAVYADVMDETSPTRVSPLRYLVALVLLAGLFAGAVGTGAYFSIGLWFVV